MSSARSDTSRSPREARRPVVDEGAMAATASVSAPSAAHLARQASFEDALRARLVAEPRMRSSRSTASCASRSFPVPPLVADLVRHSEDGESSAPTLTLNDCARSVVQPSLLANLLTPGLARSGPPPLDRLPLDDPAPFLASSASPSRLEPLAQLARPRRPALNVSDPLGARSLCRRPRLESPADAGQVALRLASVDAGRQVVADASALGPTPLAVGVGAVIVVEWARQPLSVLAPRPPFCTPLSSSSSSKPYVRIPRSFSVAPRLSRSTVFVPLLVL